MDWTRFSNPSYVDLQQIARNMADYLNIEVDPYDFQYELDEWTGKEDAEVEDLGPAQLGAFKQYLLDKGIPQLHQHDPVTAPAYTYFDHAKVLPKGSWLIHFTNESRFRKFDRGATLENLALSTWNRDKTRADCTKNLTNKIGPYEVVWGFAFKADEAVIPCAKKKYGSNALLFQSDAAVLVWHFGDEEWQVIFPLCSEYNVIPLIEPERGHIVVETEDGDELEFTSLDDLIDAVASEKIQPNPKIRRAWTR